MDRESSEWTEWAVEGQRVVIGKRHKATVRYVGPVDGQAGTWVGLEWDEESRGKHDGSYGGKRYFECSKGRTNPGSLVRLEKLKSQRIYRGISLEMAVEKRYKCQDVLDSEKKEFEQSREPRPGDFAVQVVGADLAASFVKQDGVLDQVGCAGMLVSSLEPTKRVCRFLANAKILDLSENLISSWTEILKFLKVLKNVREVNLSNNFLANIPETAECEPVEHIKVVVLNNCGIIGSSLIFFIDKMFPNLQELYLYGNRIEISGKCDSLWFQNLELLDMGNNGLCCWSSICKAFGLSPKLKTLQLEDNIIGDLTDTGSEDCPIYGSLEHLNLGNNSLTDWTSIQCLASFPSLTELRVSGNNITKIDESKSRIQIIARLESITWLNGSVVSEDERKDCELAFLRDVKSYVSHRDPALDSWLSRLEKKYAVSANSSGEKVGLKSLAEGMIHLRITHGEEKKIEKRVPGTLSVGKLKILLQRLTGIKAEDQVLLLRNAVCSHGQVLAEENISAHVSKDLSFFNVDTKEWDLLIQSAEDHAHMLREEGKAEHERRMQHQEAELQLLKAAEDNLMKL